MTDRLALPRRYRDQLEALLSEHVPGVEVWAYGSRVNGRSHDGSDLDLVLRGPALEPLDGGFYDLLEAIEKSNIPILVQAHDWAMLPEGFHREIERDYVVVQKEANQMTTGEWREVTLGEFAPFTYGKGLRTDDRIPSGDVPVIGSNGIIGYHDSPLTDGPAIVIGRKGTVGAVYYSPVPCWPIDTTFFITADDPALLKFKYFALKTLPLQEMNSDSAVPGLNRNEAHACMLRVPDETEQRAIAHILGAMDDKIDLNRRMNEMLEAMARALFKSWFVDFEPVRAKMEGRWWRGQSLPGLPAEYFDLFPDRLVDSELGEIPEEWEVRGLPEIMDYKEGPGIRHWQYTNSAEGTRFINIRCIQDGDIQLNTANRIGTEEADGKYAHFHLKEWDIVVSTSGTLGRSAVVRSSHLPLVLNTSVIRFRPIGDLTSFSFLYGYLNSPLFLNELEMSATGSVQKNFGPMHLRKIRTLCPPYGCLQRYDEIADSLVRQVIVKRAENDALAAQRDALLPGLVSGEVGYDTNGETS